MNMPIRNTLASSSTMPSGVISLAGTSEEHTYQFQSQWRPTYLVSSSRTHLLAQTRPPTVWAEIVTPVSGAITVQNMLWEYGGASWFVCPIHMVCRFQIEALFPGRFSTLPLKPNVYRQAPQVPRWGRQAPSQGDSYPPP